MMDAPAPNQSQSSCQRAVQNGLSTAEPPRPLCNPLHSFQQLNLGPPAHQTPDCNHLQGSGLNSNSVSAAFQNKTSSYDSVQQNFPDPLVSPTIQAPKRFMPPCSLPLNEGSQSFSPQQMPLYSPHSPYAPSSPQFQPLHTYQGVLNAQESPNINHLPVSPPGQHVNQTEWSSVGYNHHQPASPTSPIQQQPHWMLSAHPGGSFI